MSTEVYTDGLVIVDGVKIPRCPTRRSKLNIGQTKTKVFINSYEWTGKKWKRTIRALWYSLY